MPLLRSRSGLAVVVAFLLIFILYKNSQNLFDDDGWDGGHDAQAVNYAAKNVRKGDVEIVVAKMKKEDTSWIQHYIPHWHANVYVVDDPNAQLTVPKNKGREAMVYLTYIIDNYEKLPDNILFIHASRFAWHNDDPDYDALPALRNFQVPFLQEQGYVNLRCVWVIGCPNEIRPFSDEGDSNGGHISAKGIYKQAFQELLPDEKVPTQVAVSCCSQFAATRETIQRRPLSDYEHFRDWLLHTSYEDALSGRVLEFSWHIIFGKEPVHCPSAKECYCKVFGLCDLAGCGDVACDDMYTLPPYSTLPDGWPLVGWDREPRQFDGPLQ